MKIAEVLLPVPLSRFFDYIVNDDNVGFGYRVLVEFGKTKSQIGVVINIRDMKDNDYSNKSLKHIDKVLDNISVIDNNWYDLVIFASHYYAEPLGKAYKNSFPKLLRSIKSVYPPRLSTFQLSKLGRLAILENRLPKNAIKQSSLLYFIEKNKSVGIKKLKENNFTLADIKRLLDKNYIIEKKYSPYYDNNKVLSPDYELNNEQKDIVNKITSDMCCFNSHLIYGVTGSGKTEVYINLIRYVLEKQEQILLLVPEISLTPQMISRFKKRFGKRVAAYHSGMSEGERRDVFLSAKLGELPILIGTRSAIFVPMKKLGLILIDEEHDLSYKQQEGFLYNARDLAIYRAKKLNINIVLGSATPSLESIRNISIKKFQLHKLNKRATNSKLPKILMIDRRGNNLNKALSDEVIQKMRQTLNSKKQVLLFLNRRGFAPVMKCSECDWSSDCPSCSVFLTAHIATSNLCCHHCGYVEKMPIKCPSCSSMDIYFIGIGTQKLESQINQQFPNHNVLRLDRDNQSTSKHLDMALKKIQNNEVDIILGTQLVVKGHHFPNVEMVCVVDADNSLYSSNFRAEEYLYQQLIQVSGRAGRESSAGCVYIQSSVPDHDIFHALIKHDYWLYAKKILLDRLENLLPPYTAMTLIKASYYERDILLEYLCNVKNSVLEHSKSIEMLGPIPEAIEKIKNRYQAKLWITANNKVDMQNNISLLKQVIKHYDSSSRFRTIIDIDAI